MWKVFAQSEKSRSTLPSPGLFLDSNKTVAGRLSRPTRCRLRCSSAVLRSCFPRSNINRATLLLQLATHQRSLPRHTPSCGSSPRHCHDGSVRPTPVFQYVSASGLCGPCCVPARFFLSSDWPAVSSLSAFQSHFYALALSVPSAKKRLNIV